MTADMLLDALNGVDDSYILSAGRRLGYVSGQSARVVPFTRRQRVRRLILIAAVLTAMLLAACTAVIYLARLEDRLTPAPQPTHSEEATVVPSGGYLSPYSRGDSPEALAVAEWDTFYFEYTRAKGEECLAQGLEYNAWLNDYDWYKGDEELTAIQNLYSVYNLEMADTLRDIADRYGLKLHIAQTWPLNAQDMYKVAGVEPFFLAPSGGGEIRPYRVFEDGSFTCEGEITVSDGLVCDFYLDRNGPGYVPTSSLYIHDPESFDQWQYTTAQGHSVLIASTVMPEAEFSLHEERAYAFYEENGWSVTVYLSFREPVSRGSYEAALNCFDLSVVCTGRSDVLSFINAGPTESSTGQAISAAEFLATSEYQAAAEFDLLYDAYILRDFPRLEDRVNNFTYYGAWPSENGDLNADAQAIWEAYGLTPAADSLYADGNEIIPVENIGPTGGWRPGDYEKQPVTAEDIYALMGCEPFIEGANPVFTIIYDNDCFRTEFLMGGSLYSVHYIHKGSFYTALGMWKFPRTDMPSWRYDAAWGSTVTIGINTSEGICGMVKDSYVFYETDKAYILITGQSYEPRILEAMVDCVDLTKLG